MSHEQPNDLRASVLSELARRLKDTPGDVNLLDALAVIRQCEPQQGTAPSLASLRSLSAWVDGHREHTLQKLGAEAGASVLAFIELLRAQIAKEMR